MKKNQLEGSCSQIIRSAVLHGHLEYEFHSLQGVLLALCNYRHSNLEVEKDKFTARSARLLARF